VEPIARTYSSMFRRGLRQSLIPGSDPLTFYSKAADLILKATYGYTTEAHGADSLVDLVDQAMEESLQAFVPGEWAVDLIPALMYLLEWFPGTRWKQTAKAWNKNMTKCINIPFEYAKSQRGNGDDISLVSKVLAQCDVEKGGPSSLDFDWIKLAAVSLYTGRTSHMMFRICPCILT
jgi:hypothetical protein